MKDQAEALRQLVEQQKTRKQARAISVISGKGGVGKSNFSLNFSIALSNYGQKVLLIDMDIGMGNIDILLGNTPSKNIVHFFEGSLPLEHVITEGPSGISYIAGGTGLSDIFHLDSQKENHFFSEFGRVVNLFDFVIFDMGAGISEDTLPFLLAADEIFVIATPEPTAVTDAYAAIKYITLMQHNAPFSLICNKAPGEKEGRLTINRLQSAVKQFLGRDIFSLGILPEDSEVQRAVIRQTPFLIANPRSRISRALVSLAGEFLERDSDKVTPSAATGFIRRLRKYMFGRKA
ncbi:MinD/ParA family protein [Peribacillus sp. SCS-26]|uniref:MinD/ParA family protein n=1 Tax=Paraperibacillus marinus TaxID=3115295 RepID=UPI003906CC93